MKKHTFGAVVGLLGLVFLFGCGKRRELSERDVRREQIRNDAAMKRHELQEIVGTYRGDMERQNAAKQKASLVLEIRDVPFTDEGRIDPVLIPTLSGYLRFEFGSGLNEFIGFGLKKVDFESRARRLTLSAENETYKDIVMEFDYVDGELDGTWTAPKMSESGRIHLVRGKKKNLAPDDPNSQSFAGSYLGYLYRTQMDKTFYEAKLNIQSSFEHPDGLKITASLRVTSADENAEVFTYKYEHVDLNPANQELIIRDESQTMVLRGTLNGGQFSGRWLAAPLGEMGQFVFSKKARPAAKPGTSEIHSYRGVYRTQLNATGVGNPPPRALINITIAENPQSLHGVQVSGSIRLYIGEFGSSDFEELPFSEISLNPYSGVLTTKTVEKYHLTLQGVVFDGRITGDLFADGMGLIAKIEGIK